MSQSIAVIGFQKRDDKLVVEHEAVLKLADSIRSFIASIRFLSPDPWHKKGFEGLVSNFQGRLLVTGGMVNVLNVLVDPKTGKPVPSAAQSAQTQANQPLPPAKESRINWSYLIVIVIILMLGVLTFQRVPVSSTSNSTGTQMFMNTTYGSVMPPELLVAGIVGVIGLLAINPVLSFLQRRIEEAHGPESYQTWAAAKLRKMMVKYRGAFGLSPYLQIPSEAARLFSVPEETIISSGGGRAYFRWLLSTEFNATVAEVLNLVNEAAWGRRHEFNEAIRDIAKPASAARALPVGAGAIQAGG
ncbi:MAG: hypothetical protein WCC94_11695 [Candidatus Bathyarchaeia archaeon]